MRYQRPPLQKREDSSNSGLEKVCTVAVVFGAGSDPFLLFFIEKKDDKVEISKPTQFKRLNHVEVDIHSPNGTFPSSFLMVVGLRGLPDEWSSALSSLRLSKKEVIENKDAVVDVLKFHFTHQQLPQKMELDRTLDEGTSFHLFSHA